jgi:hypothetical protein
MMIAAFDAPLCFVTFLAAEMPCYARLDVYAAIRDA